MAPAISAACVSRAKCPVSKKRTTAFGMSRLNAFGPLVEEERFVLALGRQKGGWFPLFVAIPATTSPLVSLTLRASVRRMGVDVNDSRNAASSEGDSLSLAKRERVAAENNRSDTTT
jgi:hypothetical protein